MTGLGTRAQRGSAGSRELGSDRLPDGTGALEIRGFKPLKSKVIFVTLPYKLQEIRGATAARVHWHKGGAGKELPKQRVGPAVGLRLALTRGKQVHAEEKGHEKPDWRRLATNRASS